MTSQSFALLFLLSLIGSIAAGDVQSSQKLEPRFFGVPMKYVSLLLLVLQTVGVVAAMRYSRAVKTDGPKYLNTVAVYMSEVLKLVCSFLFLWHEDGSFMRAVRQVQINILGKPGELLKVCVPGLLYTLQNNLLFVALSNLSGAVYQVTYQLKILTTALLSVIILRKTLGGTKWGALLILTCGVTVIQWPREATASQKHGDNTMIGLVAVFAACITSGFAGVYLEKILKQSSTSIWIRNIQLALFGAIIGFAGALWQDWHPIQQAGMLQGFSPVVWLVIGLQAVGGLVVAAVLKYADNILKCFGNALSIALSCLLSAVAFKDFVPDALFVLGTILVLVATCLYSLGLPKCVQHYFCKSDMPSQKAEHARNLFIWAVCFIVILVGIIGLQGGKVAGSLIRRI